MRTITLLIVHCSAVGPGQQSSAADIDRWHRAHGWKCIGYHYVVRRDGSVETGRPECDVGAHCQDHNRHSIGICYEGGLDYEDAPNGKGDKLVPADTRTEEQKTSLLKLLKDLHERYPKAIIVGHHDLNPMKACPCFDAVKEYRELQPK